MRKAARRTVAVAMSIRGPRQCGGIPRQSAWSADVGDTRRKSSGFRSKLADAQDQVVDRPDIGSRKPADTIKAVAAW
jgi:hypothetical protein